MARADSGVTGLPTGGGGINPMGEWSGVASYVTGDSVQHANHTWYAAESIAAGTEPIIPPDDIYIDLTGAAGFPDGTFSLNFTPLHTLVVSAIEVFVFETHSGAHAAGTLGIADPLVASVAAPTWRGTPVTVSASTRVPGQWTRYNLSAPLTLDKNVEVAFATLGCGEGIAYNTVFKAIYGITTGNARYQANYATDLGAGYYMKIRLVLDSPIASPWTRLSADYPAFQRAEVQVIEGNGVGGGTKSGTWAKPSWATRCHVLVIGSGAGGGSGRRGAAGTIRNGGAGGASGNWEEAWLRCEFMPESGFYAIEAPGAGGAAVTTDNTNGNPGTTGAGNTYFNAVTPGNQYNNFVGAYIVSGGSGGNASTSVSGGPGQVLSATRGRDSAKGADATSTGAGTGTADAGSPTTVHAAGGGGAGGGINASDALTTRSSGGTKLSMGWARTAANATPEGEAGANGQSYYHGGGAGGRGGVAGLTMAGGKGGDGGKYGGGGAGGGASVNGFNSGAGGAGGIGAIIITWYG